MRAYLIDTPNKQIFEVEWNGDYKHINALIKAEIYTVVRIPENGDAIFVDDEGLINGNPHGWFVHADYPQPLRGYGLVLGTDDDTGESCEPNSSLEELRAQITFPNDDELDEPESYARAEVIGFNTMEELFANLFGTKT